MILLPSSSLKIVLIAIVSFCICETKAQTALLNVPEAFNAIGTKPKLLRLKRGLIKIPAGGHLQGIQRLSDSDLVVTASSASISYYLLARINHSSCNGSLDALQKITDKPFRHAGGCQVSENKLFVGIEDNITKNKSEIIMISLDDSLKQKKADMIARRAGEPKRATAGAVGATKTGKGRYLIAVGDWDSRNIDFYLSRIGKDGLFDSLTTFQAPDNQKWVSYQAINLLSDTIGNIYLIGFGLDGLNNQADLFKVELSKDRATMKLLSSRNFNCKGGAGFRYGSGIGTAKNGSLVIYCCGRNVGSNLAVNIFESHP